MESWTLLLFWLLNSRSSPMFAILVVCLAYSAPIVCISVDHVHISRVPAQITRKTGVQLQGESEIIQKGIPTFNDRMQFRRQP